MANINPYTHLVENEAVIIETPDRSKYFNRGWTYEQFNSGWRAFNSQLVSHPEFLLTSDSTFVPDDEMDVPANAYVATLGVETFDVGLADEISTVPEPTSLLLFGIVIAGIARRMRR